MQQELHSLLGRRLCLCSLQILNLPSATILCSKNLFFALFSMTNSVSISAEYTIPMQIKPAGYQRASFLPSFHQDLPFHPEAADFSSPHLSYINMQTLCLVLFSQPRGPQAWEKGRGEGSPGISLHSMREGTSPGAHVCVCGHKDVYVAVCE